MKVNELRIGNIVLRKRWLYDVDIRERYFNEIVIGLNNIQACYVNPDAFKPIELNEDWLLKFGFKLIDGEYWNEEEKIFGLVIQVTENGKEFLHVWDGDFTGSPCKYVHQLQNLYFALTGKELIYKK